MCIRDSYITSQVFDAPDKAEKVYFSLEATEDGHAYNMVMARDVYKRQGHR